MKAITALWKAAEYLVSYFTFMVISLYEWPMNFVKLCKYVYAPEKLTPEEKMFFQVMEEIVRDNHEAALKSGIIDTLLAIAIVYFLMVTLNVYLQALAVIIVLSTIVDIFILIMVCFKIEEEERISHIPKDDDRW